MAIKSILASLYQDSIIAWADNIEEALAGVTYYYKDVSSGVVVREIENEIKNFNADLLIMIPQKYGFWESLVHRSKTRIMASNCNIPLLSIPL